MGTTETNKSLSEKFYAFEWKNFFPYRLSKSGIEVRYTSITAIDDYLLKNSSSLFSERAQKSQFTFLQASVHKRAFMEQAVDHFAFFHHQRPDEMIGFYSGNPVDWETYYMRFIHLLPEYRGSCLSTEFYTYFLQVLKEVGIKKAEAHVAGNNFSQLKKFLSLGFHPAGTLLSTRWGTSVRLIKFNDERAKAVYEQQFCLLY